jgi:hypothetical protein
MRHATRCSIVCALARAAACAAVWAVAGTVATPVVYAADGIAGTWFSGETSSGQTSTDQTFVFRVRGDAFIGIVCGPCDDPSTVFQIADGRILDAARISFSIVHDTGGPLFGKVGPYRDQVSGTLSGTRLSLERKRVGGTEAAASLVLNRVLRKREAAPAPASSRAVGPASSAIDGRWVSVGRVAQQNLTLKVRGNHVSGVICGPCDDPDGVFLVEDGTLDGSTISFFIHHIDTPVASVQANGPGRNFMKGTISGNVMRFTWVREGRESEPGGEMVFTGPIR